jgi:hypothetical protein
MAGYQYLLIYDISDINFHFPRFLTNSFLPDAVTRCSDWLLEFESRIIAHRPGSEPNKFPFQFVLVSITTDYGLDCRSSLSGRGKGSFSSPQHLEGSGTHSAPLFNGYWGLVPKELATHNHVVARSRILDLYFHSPLRLQGVVLNCLSNETRG